MKTEQKIQKMTRIGIILFVINSIIGSGIFLTPDSVIKQVYKLTPIVYILAGTFAITLGLTFAAAARYVQTNGAAYAYTEAAFKQFKKGKYVGQYVGISRWTALSVGWGTAAAFLTATLIRFYNNNVGEANRFKLVEGKVDLIEFIVFISVLLLMVGVNLFGVKLFQKISNATTITKLLALIMFIIVGIITVISIYNSQGADKLVNNYNSAEKSLTKPVDYNLQLVISAIVTALYAFAGFENVASGTEDMEEPEKNLPKAIIIGLITIMVIYVSTVSLAMLMGSATILKSTEAIKLLAVVDNQFVRTFITIGAIISMFGLNITSAFSTPRVLTALADNNQVPAIFAKKNKYNIPIVAVFVSTVIAAVVPLSMGFATGTISELSVISRFVQFALVPISVMILYKTADFKNKKFVQDVIMPILSLILVAVLLINYDWTKLFLIKKGSEITNNYPSIIGLTTIFIILPALAILWRIKNKN